MRCDFLREGINIVNYSYTIVERVTDQPTDWGRRTLQLKQIGEQ